MAQQHNANLPVALRPLPPGLPPRPSGPLPDFATYALHATTSAWATQNARNAGQHNRTTFVGRLPVEVVENIASFVASPNSPWINDYHEDDPHADSFTTFGRASQDLRSMALTCIQFRLPAQERLFHAPFLHGIISPRTRDECHPHHAGVQCFLRTLFRRPDLARKVRQLRVHIKMQEAMNICFLAAQNACDCADEWVLEMCLAQVRQMKLQDERKQILELDLKKPWFLAMVCIVLNLVPNLDHLAINNSAHHNEIGCLFGKIMITNSLDSRRYIRYPPLQYEPLSIPHIGGRTEGIASLSGIAHIQSLRMEVFAPIHRFPSMVNFVPSVKTLDLLLRTKPTAAWAVLRGSRDFPGTPLLNITHLRIDARVKQFDFRAVNFLGYLEDQLPYFGPLRNLEVYGEPPTYDHAQHLIAGDSGEYKSSYMRTTFWNLVGSLRGVANSLTSLKMPRGFWTLPRLEPVPGVSFAHFSVLEELEVPKEMLLGTSRTQDPRYQSLVIDLTDEEVAETEPPPKTPAQLLPRSLRVLKVLDMDSSACGWIGELLSTCDTVLPQLVTLELECGRGVGEEEREHILEEARVMAEDTRVKVEMSR